MKFRLLSKTDKEITGANFAVTVDYTDLAGLANGNTGSFNLAPYQGTTQGGASDAATKLAIGTKIELIAAAVTTGFTFSDASIVNSPVVVGDSGSSNRYLASTETIAGSQVAYIVGGTKYALLAADNVIAAFTGTAAHNLNTATAGSVTFWLRLDDLTQFNAP